ncbi:E3 ubiquitin-protein ligase TRIM21-like [Notolabrus celidotus]|uniref:E3 ubiquitin-protein ligase TRIM21-like n=1 Tax=Notolabrus celidotus TaxID=1203425 RepID=UPI00148F906A|nr:E3 ubiquitin-protein ligase TRIM21-like [Notolabrus celidotus]
MSAASCVLSEDQFLCCICLDVFNEPVTIPCGHNFCKMCITQHWNINHAKYHCPMCKKQFKLRPELTVNTFISEMAAEFRQSAAKKSRRDPEIKVAKPGEIPCDVCTGPKLKAMKSCLTCLASYCGIHIDPHMTADSLKRHQLTDPVENLDARVCSKHKKPLDLFCKSDQICVCSNCTVSEHMGHNITSLKDEFEAKKTQLEDEDAEVQQMIQQRRLKLQQMKCLKSVSKEDAESAIADGVRIFTLVSQTAERSLNELIEVIEERRKTAEQETDGVITELEQEIYALTRQTAQVKQLTHTQDHLLLLQNFSSMRPTVDCTKNWTKVRVCLPTYEGTVGKAVAELEEAFSREKQQLPLKSRVKRAQQFAVDLILDPQTANPWLVVSDDNKEVRCGGVRKELPDNPDRFSLYANVVAQQSFSTGRFYYEVQVSGKTDWTLGVVNKSVNRKGIIPLSPVHGYWSVGLRSGNEFLTFSSPVFSLNLDSRPQRVGVFVSYEEGLVSFYNVEAGAHVYSFTDCSFTEELCPFFSPGLDHGGANSDPLIISPVHITD